MTDKVQKIREEVVRMHNLLPVMDSDNISVNYADRICTTLEMYIDSMQKEEIPPKFPIISQKKCMYTKDSYTDEDRKVLCDGCEEKCEYSKREEPVSIWHDASEEPNGDNSIVIAYDNGCTVEPSFKDFKSYSEYGIIKKSYRVKQWAYVNDVLNLTNKEEPVSEDLNTELEKYIKDHFTIDTEQLDRFGIEEKDYMYSMDKSDMLALVEHFTNWQKTKEEPVSEDLEEESKEWLNPQLDKSYAAYGKTKQMELTHFDGYAMLDAIEFGAKWQKRKDKQNFKELAVLASHQDGCLALENIQMRLNELIKED